VAITTTSIMPPLKSPRPMRVPGSQNSSQQCLLMYRRPKRSISVTTSPNEHSSYPLLHNMRGTTPRDEVISVARIFMYFCIPLHNNSFYKSPYDTALCIGSSVSPATFPPRPSPLRPPIPNAFPIRTPPIMDRR
jgi:hypothetical protein